MHALSTPRFPAHLQNTRGGVRGTARSHPSHSPALSFFSGWPIRVLVFIRRSCILLSIISGSSYKSSSPRSAWGRKPRRSASSPLVLTTNSQPTHNHVAEVARLRATPHARSPKSNAHQPFPTFLR